VIATLAIRGLVAHKLRLAVTVVAIALGVAFVSAAMIFSATTNAALDRLFTAAGKGTDAVVRPQQLFAGNDEAARSADLPVPATVLRTVQGIEGVADVHGAVSGFAAIVDKNGKVVTSAQGAPQIGVDWTEDPDFSRMHLRSGRGPHGQDEIAIDVATAERTGYRVGDQITVVLRGPSRTFTLAGIFALGGANSTGGMSIVAFEPTTAQRLLMEQPGTYSQIDVHARPGVSQTKVRNAVARVLPTGFEVLTGQEASDESSGDLRPSLDIFPRLLLWFSVVAVFVGSFIIVNTFSILVVQRTRELALLRAVGASRRQVRRLVLGEAAGLGLIGSLLGLGAGAALAAALRALINSFGGDAPAGGLVLSASTVLWAFAVGTLVTLAAAYVPARRAATVPPVAAMLDDASRRIRSLRPRAWAGSAMTAAGGASMVAAGANPTGSKAGILLGAGALLVFAGVTILSPVLGKPAARVLGWPFARFLGAAGMLGRENAQRNPRRTAATASALMIGLALSGAVTVMASSLKTSLDRQLDEGLGSDYVVSSKGENPFSPRATDAVSRVPGVRSAVAIRTARLELDGRVRSAVAGDPRPLAAAYRLTMTDGPLALAAGELLISKHIARSNDWAVGTTVAARLADGERGSLRVAGIYADPPIGPAIILDPASYRGHYPSTLISQIEITTDPTADGVATRKQLQSALRAWPGLDLQDQEDIKAAAHSSIDEFVSAILALLALSVVIAALGIVNTLGLSVIERSRELGLLRAVGMDRGQLRHMIRYESLIIAVFGALLGLGLGVLYGSALQRASAADGMAALSIPFRQLALYLLAGVAIGVAAAIWPARRAARVRILQAISHE
jgi:ABC-type antimicrobial peptide transport system permease subunit